MLAADGLISSRKGTRRLVLQQTLVQNFSQLHSFSQWAASIGETPSGRLVSLVRREPTELEAGKLELDPGARIYHLTRLRLLSGRPVMVERTAYVERIGALVGGIVIDGDDESVTIRLEELGVVFAHAEHTVSAIPAEAEDADLLGVRPRTLCCASSAVPPTPPTGRWNGPTTATSATPSPSPCTTRYRPALSSARRRRRPRQPREPRKSQREPRIPRHLAA
ncbi:GntR family transcriptional regulator [Streptosporangium lutulentum]